jgi:hypothetical protein
MYKDIDLTNPNLGKELLADALGQLPYDVWLTYVCQRNGERSEMLGWCIDPDDPDVAPIDPQQAVDQAEPLVSEVIKHIMSNSRQEALEAATRAIAILIHGSSEYQRGRGRPSGMRHLAVRAWLIRKFNPHPKKPDESTVRWAKLADKLFRKDGKCPRMIDSEGTIVRREPCGLTKHQYDSPCVKALMTAVGNLESAMKDDRIPT